MNDCLIEISLPRDTQLLTLEDDQNGKQPAIIALLDLVDQSGSDQRSSELLIILQVAPDLARGSVLVLILKFFLLDQRDPSLQHQLQIRQTP